MTTTLERPIVNTPPAVTQATATPIRCLIVDDHPVVRAGLRTLLGDDPRFEVCDSVGTAEEAVEIAARCPVDVVIVDYQLGGRSGLWASRKLKRLPDPPAVLLFSAYPDGVLAAACVIAEADGMLAKSQIDIELREAVTALAAGETRLPLMTPRLSECLRMRLEPDEQAIFGMLSAGLPKTAIVEVAGVTAEDLESRLWTMLRAIETMDLVPR